MLRRCLLISCLSLSTIALYSCKNSDSKSAPATATASQKKLGKNLTLNFDSFIGEDYNYTISGEKKCETDANPLPFNNETSLLITENEECTISIHELKATGKTDNKIFIFSPKVASKYLILKINNAGKLNTPSPVLYISNEDNFEKYLAAKLNGDSLNLVLNTLSYIETKLTTEIDELLAKAPEAPNAERTLNLAVTINSASLPANLIAVEKTAKFTRKFGSQYALVDSSMNLKTTLSEIANNSNCKITDNSDFSQFTKTDFQALSDCSQKLEFNKQYTILFSEDSSWDLDSIKMGSISAVSPQLALAEMPKISDEVLQQEEKTLNNNFKIALDKYTRNFLTKYDALDKVTQSDKVTLLSTKLKEYYKKLDSAFKNRTNKDYIPEGFVLQNNEIEKIEVVDLTPQQPTNTPKEELSNVDNQEQKLPVLEETETASDDKPVKIEELKNEDHTQEETETASDDKPVKKEELKNEDHTQEETKKEESNTQEDNKLAEETQNTPVVENKIKDSKSDKLNDEEEIDISETENTQNISHQDSENNQI